jgi:hypothetical protein
MTSQELFASEIYLKVGAATASDQQRVAREHAGQVVQHV